MKSINMKLQKNNNGDETDIQLTKVESPTML